MRRVAPFLILPVLLASEPGYCASELRPLLNASGKPLEVKAEIPDEAGVAFSFALPGASQFYLGDAPRGWLYVALTCGLGAGLAFAQNEIYFSNQSYVLPESIAAETLQGFAISWLTMGIISAIDAHRAIASRQPSLSATAP